MNEMTDRHGSPNPLRLRRRGGTDAQGVVAPALAGLFLLWPEPGIAELAALLGVDFVVIDMEAGAFGRAEVMRLVQVLSGWPVTTLVRVASHEPHVIEHVLDIGAHGVMVPKVNSVAEAEAVARTTRFPPQGRRGVNPARASAYFGDLPGYFGRVNDEVLCVVQIETGEAVAEAQKIAAVPGIDGLFLGMGDLAMDLGQPGIVTGSQMDQARSAVLDAARSNGVLAGAFAYGDDVARAYRREGFDLIAIGNDIKLLRESIATALRTFREGDDR
jgi:2-keto-3-deoxy-L-rhamnonate aldolase RhmA